MTQNEVESWIRTHEQRIERLEMQVASPVQVGLPPEVLKAAYDFLRKFSPHTTQPSPQPQDAAGE